MIAATVEVLIELSDEEAMEICPPGRGDVYFPGRARLPPGDVAGLIARNVVKRARFRREATDEETEARRDANAFDGGAW